MQTVPSAHCAELLQILLQAPSLHTSFFRQSASALEHFREHSPLRHTPPGPGQAASPVHALASAWQPCRWTDNLFTFVSWFVYFVN